MNKTYLLPPSLLHTAINSSRSHVSKEIPVCDCSTTSAMSFFFFLTPESFAAPAVEHLSLLHLARATVLTWVGQAGVVATLAHPAAVQTVASVLLQVQHPVVDVQQADAADQTRGHPGPFHHAAEGEEEGEDAGFLQ